jgi:TetR/AcrR family transcriptional regulator, lmrAB and yxaGH operons repressor
MAGEQDRRTERQVDEEDEAPVGELDQRAAERRPDRRRGGRGSAPEAHSGGPFLDREAVEDDRQGGRGDRRRADALQDAEGDQRLQRGRDRAEQAGEGEAGEAGEEDPLVAEAVGEAAGRDEQRRDHHEVAVEHPGQEAAARLRERRRDVGEGDVDDRRVEEGEEGAGAGNQHARSMTTVIHRGGDYTMSVGITRIVDAEAVEPARRDGRERLLNGARRLLAEKGYAGMELRDVAERGKAPRGSIYHHFPGGKRQLAIEAAELEGTEIRAAIERSLRERGLAETLTMFGEMFRRRVKDQPERLGCPVAAAALARPEDPALAAAATKAFQSWEAPIAAALRDEGVGKRDAETFAGLVVSTVEGALIRARAAGDEAPLASAVAGLRAALDALLNSRSRG